MTFRVILLPGAESDLEVAFIWIAEHSPDAAARWLAGIDAAISTLREMPLRCSVAGDDSAARLSCGKCSTADGKTGIAHFVHRKRGHGVRPAHSTRRESADPPPSPALAAQERGKGVAVGRRSGEPA
jgi:hypothetical protein